MAKGDKFYFDNFVASSKLSREAAGYLVWYLENYDANQIEQMLKTMHDIENRADAKKHEMNAALAKAFVTPVDREDLDMLSHQIDDVTDIIEEVLQKFYIHDVQTILPTAVTFAKNIVRSCELLCDLMGEFENVKRSKKIHSLIVELNDVEEECDKLYLASMRDLARSSYEVLTIIAWRDIFNCMEACADACEHVSECVGSGIMKNT